MIKVITSVTVFNDAVGMRMSATYSIIDESTGLVVNDNVRFDRVITEEQYKADANELFEYADESIPQG